MDLNFVTNSSLAAVISGEQLTMALDFASRFHPVVVHFPIALGVAALLAELLSMLPRQQWASAASRFCILLAAAGAIAAGLTGWLKFTHGPMTGVTPDDATNLHRWVGTASAALTLLAAFISSIGAFLPESTKTRWLYRIVLVLAVGVVGFSGHLGGLLVFGSEHFSLAE